MHFAFVLSFFFMMMSAVFSAPTGPIFMRTSCDIAKCVAALAPSVVSCAGAAATEGANPIADAACLASAINTLENTPAACQPCMSEFNIVKTAKTVEKDAVSVAHKAEDVIGSIF